MDLNFTLVVLLTAIFIGLSKGGFGGPVLVSFLTPILSQVMPATQAVGLVLPLLIIGDVIAVMIYWKQWDIQQVKLMLPLAIVGILLGSALLLALAESHQDLVMRRILGAFTLMFVIYRVARSQFQNAHYVPRKWHGQLVGWASGFGSALANLGSPPFTAYMLMQDVSPTIFIGTSTLFFFIVNVLKLPMTLLSSNVLNLHTLVSVLWVIPVIPAATWVGRQFTIRVAQERFEQLILVMLFIMSLYMLLG
jgi:uncharacterized membrane protein YfcA